MKELGKIKKQDILDKILDIEQDILKKIKKHKINTPTLNSFGDKLKAFGVVCDNRVLNNALWTMLHIRNNIVHTDNGNIVTLKEYQIFISCYNYAKYKIKGL
jgi:hypothetical protein